MNYILDILSSFNSLCNEHFGVLEGIIYSVEPLDKKYIQQIQDILSKKENVKCELKNIIDKSLIGGLKVMINDHIYDDSIKFHLEKMKSTLLK
jgi:F-type H+-transporting ATPase subunit delta